MKIRPGVELAHLTDVGCQRQNNEDSYGYWEPADDAQFAAMGRLAIVADGMGGYEGGQIASRAAVEVFTETYAASTENDPQQRLRNSLSQAHQRIQEKAKAGPRLHSMGTTCTALALVNDRLYFVHVGDSRLYLLRDGKLQTLTRDHTLIARLLENGLISPDQAKDHPQKNVLTSALGVADGMEVDFPTSPLPILKGDIFMMCTDGLWGQIDSPEIQQALGSQPPKAACRTLVQLAKARGGPDNITLQILRVL